MLIAREMLKSMNISNQYNLFVVRFIIVFIFRDMLYSSVSMKPFVSVALADNEKY